MEFFFVWLLIGVGAAAVAWMLWKSESIVRPWLRILVRAFALALVLTPFIPHGGIQWSLPFPPASFWVVVELAFGKKVATFELVSILFTTLLFWLVGYAIYSARQRREGA